MYDHLKTMLDYINYNESVLIATGGAVDEYGISTEGDKVRFSCYTKATEQLIQVTNTDGSLSVISGYVVVPGKCNAGTGDYIYLDDERKAILSKQFIKDFDGNILSTKFGV